MSSSSNPTITSVLKETRTFPPPPEFVAKAAINSPRGLRTALQACQGRSGGLLGRTGRIARLDQALGQGARLERAARPMVRRRQAQRQRQLPRPASRRAAPQQGRHHLGRRTRRQPRADAIRCCTARSASSPTSSRARASRPATASPSTCRWSPKRRSPCWPAPASAPSHSVIFGGFSADAVADRNNDAKAKLVVTADGGWRRGKVVPLKQNVDEALDKSPTVAEVHRLQPLQSASRHEGRPRSLVARTDGRRLRRLPAEPPRQRTSALHPLHQRLDRQTQGRPAHDGRLPARRVA